MKLFASFLALTFIATASAQQIVSPEVLPDGRVTFRLRATNASVVQVRGEGVGTTNMVKDDQGVWSFTASRLNLISTFTRSTWMVCR
jgi:hypothetical protein